MSVKASTELNLTDRRRVCEYCGKVCSSSSALLYHTRLHTGERPYVCKFCNKGFIQKVHLQRHIENNHLPKSSSSNSMVESSQLPTMVVPGNRLEAVANQLKSRAEPVQCPQCCEKFMGQIALLEHVFESHGEQAVDETMETTNFEPEDSPQPQSPPAPVSNDTPVKPGSRAEPNQCPHCPQQFVGQIAILEHLFEAHQEKTATPDNSTSGSVSNDVVNRKNTWCDLCQKHLSSPTALMVHLRTHSGVKPYVCNLCTKTFMHQNSLKVHMLSHSGTRPHACRVCGKCFTTTRTLKIHMMIHTGERPYGCKFCGRRFIQQIHLLRHIKSHIRKGSTANDNPQSGNECSDKGNNLNSTIGSSNSSFHFNDMHTPGNETTNGNGLLKSEPNDDFMDIAEDKMILDRKTSSSDPSADWSPANDNHSSSSTPFGDNGTDLAPVLPQPKQQCLNCHLVDGELKLLKAELSQLKQFLGNKLSLMEQKVDSMSRCLDTGLQN